MNKLEGYVRGVTRTPEAELRDRIIKRSPGSILTIAPKVNKAFGGLLPDDAPISELVNIFIDPVSGAIDVTLTDIWNDVEATQRQLDEIKIRFRFLVSSSASPSTMSKLRRLARERSIRKIPDVDKGFELFCADSFRKIGEDSSGE